MHELDEKDRERTHGGESTGHGQVLAGHDVGVEEDEAAQEDLHKDQVAKRDVDDPPQVSPKPETELPDVAHHVGPRKMQRDRQQPKGDQACRDRPFDEALARVEEP